MNTTHAMIAIALAGTSGALESAPRTASVDDDRPSRSVRAQRSDRSDAGVYYAGCHQVRALGKAPLYAGQPGYRIEMDGDRDGIACEPIPKRRR